MHASIPLLSQRWQPTTVIRIEHHLPCSMVEDIDCIAQKHPEEDLQLLKPWRAIHGTHGSHGCGELDKDRVKGDDGRMVVLDRRAVPDAEAGSV